MTEETVKKWNTIYPVYINSAATIAEGRRVGQGVAVDKPTLEEISQVLSFLKLKHCIEGHKGFPRDTLMRGRIKVLLKDEHGQLMHNEIVHKRQLLYKLCEYIPKLKTRVEGSMATAETGGGASKKNKKKNKNK